MLREEYQNMGLGLKEIPNELLYVVDVIAGRCQNLADKEIAKLKAEYAAEIAALTKPSPQLIVPNPYNKIDCCYKEWNEGFAAGIKAETVRDELENEKVLMIKAKSFIIEIRSLESA